jgi:hypothetical protein
MIILRIFVQDIAEVIANYNQIRIYRDTSEAGAFSTVDGNVTLVAGTTKYVYNDTDGLPTHWYKLSYFHTGTSAESSKSGPYRGVPSSGELGLVTTSYIKANTDFEELRATDDSKVAELIIRAESLLNRYAQAFGGFLTSKLNYSVNMPIAVRLLLEELWLRGKSGIREQKARGYTRERIGTYEYTIGSTTSEDKGYIYTILGYFTPEIYSIINYYLAAKTRVFMKTTQIFPELAPVEGDILTPDSLGIAIRPYHDYLDIEIASDKQSYPHVQPSMT